MSDLNDLQSNSNNPFLGLFANSENSSSTLPLDGPSPPPSPAESTTSKTTTQSNVLDTKINAIIEKIFLFTINKDKELKRPLVYMEEIAPLSETGLFQMDLLEQALFERLLLPDPENHILPVDQTTESNDYVVETKVIIYLYRAFEMCEQMKNKNDTIILDLCSKIRSMIMRNVCTSIERPELYGEQSLPLQWLDILKDSNNEESIRKEFLKSVIKYIEQDDCDEIIVMGKLKSIFYPMFIEILKHLRDLNMINLDKWIIEVVMLFVSDKEIPQLGELLIDFTTPNPNTKGREYAETFFGQLLSLSILPKYQNGPFEYYSTPSDALSTNLNESLWCALSAHLDKLHIIFKKLLTLNDSVKSKTLQWIGDCLHANIPRGQIWNTHNLMSMMDLTNASDSFMINLCGVLLRLCSPLFKPNFKVLLVDPTYCAVPNEDRLAKKVHLKDIIKETCLIPREENEICSTANSYNFITECFFMTHKAIDLSYRVCFEMFMRLVREIGKLEKAYEDAMAQGNMNVADSMKQMLEKLTQQFLCLKQTLIEPNNDQLLVDMCEATSIWLIEVATRTQEDLDGMTSETGYAPKIRKFKTFPISDYVPFYLKCIPEYLIQNISKYLTFFKHVGNQSLRIDIDAQSSIFRMIIIFIGSIERIRNPHLRAELAEGLESLLPREYPPSLVTSSFNNSAFTTRIFDCHPDRLEIIPRLLNVFVSIEMTGQSVEFEQKFQYRRPMYSIMEFLWEREEQKECFRKLALEAEEKIEEINPPIFLRFINLLINDAIHLLDDSLTNLQQIRVLQAEQDSPEWQNLSEAERRRNISGLLQFGNLTRFDNILGRDSINMLKLLTTEIKGIFCHKSMVDRVAAMLNYFLLNLVGPKMKEFKVKDRKEFEFDPAYTVKEICSIYINLKDNDEFCLAVSQDGRSYSKQLFEYADQVLRRIGGGQLIGDMSEFAIKVQEIEKKYMQDQEALTDIPDEYLDPIMSTLMTDPVILPSSHVTVDRSTIARHLLSDQSDPFNRSPLTMDQIKPNVELKEEIMQWIQQKRKEYKENQQQQQQQGAKESQGCN